MTGKSQKSYWHRTVREASFGLLTETVPLLSVIPGILFLPNTAFAYCSPLAVYQLSVCLWLLIRCCSPASMLALLHGIVEQKTTDQQL